MLDKLVRNNIVILLLVLTGAYAQAQTVSNVRASMDPDNQDQVIILYDLSESSPNQRFTIELRSSHNQYQNVLLLVSGDVGENISAGTDRRIEWRAREEMGLHSGTVTFEVTATLSASPLRLNSPRLGQSFESGMIVPITWEGGFQNSTIKIELFKANVHQIPINTGPNNYRYDWTVPDDLPAGTDYAINLYDVNNQSGAVMSSNFGLTVKKKKGGKTALIIGAVAVVGGGVAYLLTRPKDEPAPNPTPPGNGGDTFEFPDPPTTPTTIHRQALITFSF